MLIGVFLYSVVILQAQPAEHRQHARLIQRILYRLDDVCFNLRAVSLFPLPGWFVGPKYDTMSLSGDERSGFYVGRLETGA